MPNRLANESSLYLRQHADNPVDWHPWGREAFAKAEKDGKPLLVSIGYSSCHWCHVMAHESFENDYIAGLMNKHFVCVKVDREERPDVDQIYMEAVQMIAQHGGWPLNVFCFPDGRPFFGGTYFPPEDSGNNMIPWPQLLMRVKDFYEREKPKLEENAQNILQNLAAMNTPVVTGPEVLAEGELISAAKAICEGHDDDFGGFGSAPKFPGSMTLNFLMELKHLLESRPENDESHLKQRLDQVVETTLKGMAHGGLYDQIGGGFTRYSTDRFWLIPHFEKMLYDNGLLLQTYTRAWQRYRNPLYRAVAEETADWAMREMRSPETGLFYSSIDADSEGEEGKFYVWTPEEIVSILGEKDGARFCQAYNITGKGNFERGMSNPALAEGDFTERESSKDARAKLLQAREQRVRPATDRKHLVSWNSLMIKGLAEAGFYLERKDLFDAASDAADFIWDSMRFDGNRLYSVFHDKPSINGYLDDYAFYAEALLALAGFADLYEPGNSRRILERARRIADAADEHFADPAAVGYFFTSDDHEELIARRKEWWDNATPAGNSSLLHVFSQLHTITGDEKYRKSFTRLRKAYSGFAKKIPNGIPHALTAITAETAGVRILRMKTAGDLAPVREVLLNNPRCHPFTIDDPATDRPEGYRLCIGTVCLKPVGTINELERVLRNPSIPH